VAPRILITDSEQHAALAATRSLGRAGYEVYICSSQRLTLAGLSRYPSGRYTVPDPLGRPVEYADAVRALCESLAIDVLLPMTDQSLLALLPVRDRIASRIPWPPLASVEQAADKRGVMELARQLGIAVPAQRVLESRAAVASYDTAALPFPVVVKPSRSLHIGERFEVSHAANADELRQRLARLTAPAFPVLVQERIIGPGSGVFLLRWDGKTIAHFAHRRLRENPPSGGASTFCESIVPDPQLLRLSEAVLDQLDWQGVAMLEYKFDAKSGTPYLMEINGRFWGSLQLAIDSGVDFPRRLVDLAMGNPPGPRPWYRAGVRLRSLLRDLDHVVARARHSTADLHLPPDALPRGKAVRSFFHWRWTDRIEIFRVSDPLPVLREALNFLRRRS
jgi:predicted ATP-grasp superfamily ATP-dependent carboligase